MVSFKHKLVEGLQQRGIETCDDLGDSPFQAVLVIGGTRQLGGLWRARRQGVRVVQRLDGMNWLHRLRRGKKDRSDLRHYLRAEYGNAILSLIRRRLAHSVIYQSGFVRGWWERVYGSISTPNRVIYNGVDLQKYSPQGAQRRPEDRYRLLLVEGSLAGGYEQGLESAVGLAIGISSGLAEAQGNNFADKPVELMVAGRVAGGLQEYWTQQLDRGAPDGRARLLWAGLAPPEQIPDLDRSAHLLYSADINAACPNSVIEALACGLPALAFDTGALPELVTGEAGRIVSYGGDPWKLDAPDVKALTQAGLEILGDQENFRQAARRRAEQAFGLEQMVEAYMDVLLRD
jgi:glycosyltransferase involved in cell wall biosynthesis